MISFDQSLRLLLNWSEVESWKYFVKMSQREIYYSDKYTDDEFEYRLEKALCTDRFVYLEGEMNIGQDSSPTQPFADTAFRPPVRPPVFAVECRQKDVSAVANFLLTSNNTFVHLTIAQNDRSLK